MAWLSGILVGLLTGALGAVVAGYVANLAVDWYRISSFEGGSGYFVVGMALLGLVGGLLIGGVVALRVGAVSAPDFFRSLGIAFAIVLGVIGTIGGIARAMADLPPTLDGETLLLAVEVRWPSAHTASPAQASDRARLTLASVDRGARRLRRAVSGPLWTEDARLEDGRWIAPGAVHLFTSRGDRLLAVELGDTAAANFLLPLPRRIGKADLHWTEWMPRARPGQPPLPDGFTYRYRLHRTSEPIRTESFGGFEIRTLAQDFYVYEVDGRRMIGAVGAFQVQHRGQQVPVVRLVGQAGDDSFALHLEKVATVPGPRPALVVYAAPGWGIGECQLLIDEGDRVRVELITTCESHHQPLAISSDPDRFRQARDGQAPRGLVDHQTFAKGGLYQFDQAVLDTRSLTVRRFQAGNEHVPIQDLPPLALSPDERSLVRVYTDAAGSSTHTLRVIDIVGGKEYVLPIDRRRMRYPQVDELDPGWLAHHFAWRRDADGVDRLVERAAFSPLPNRGTLSESGDGYRLWPYSDELQDALIEFLMAELHAERVASDSPESRSFDLRIGGRVVNVYQSNHDELRVTEVYPFAEYAPGEPNIARVVAERFDAALATGRYDALFEH